jgi:hypothetical protein
VRAELLLSEQQLALDGGVVDDLRAYRRAYTDGDDVANARARTDDDDDGEDFVEGDDTEAIAPVVLNASLFQNDDVDDLHFSDDDEERGDGESKDTK